MHTSFPALNALKSDLTQSIQELASEWGGSVKLAHKIVFTRVHSFRYDKLFYAFYEELSWFAIEEIGVNEVYARLLIRKKSVFFGERYQISEKLYSFHYYQLDVNTTYLVWQSLAGKLWNNNDVFIFDNK